MTPVHPYTEDQIIEIIQAATKAASANLSTGLKHEAESIGSYAANKVITSPTTFRTPTAYASVIAANAAKRFGKRQARYTPLDDEGAGAADISVDLVIRPSEALVVSQALPAALEIIRKEVARLAAKDRLTLVAFYFFELSFEEVAILAGSTKCAVVRRWYRVVRALHADVKVGINKDPLLRELFGHVIADRELFLSFLAVANNPDKLMQWLDDLSR